MKVTLKDIAQVANVSISTVSRVLTETEYVKPETRELVKKTIKSLGYSYKKVKEQTEERNNAILIICGDIVSQVYVNYIRGITDKIEPYGYKAFVVDSEYNSKKEESYLEYAIKNNFAGTIMLSVIRTDEIVKIVSLSKHPIIFVNRYLISVDTDIVCIDNYRGGYIATKYLIDSGHKHIVHLGGPQNSTTCNERMRGYIDCLNDNGLINNNDDIFYGNLQYESGYEFAKKLAHAKKDITAVFSANDIMASALVDGLREFGVRVPEDISIVCSDNTLAAYKSKVKLTCVSYDDKLIGTAAGDLLLERIDNPNSPKKKVVYCPELTSRDSVKILT